MERPRILVYDRAYTLLNELRFPHDLTDMSQNCFVGADQDLIYFRSYGEYGEFPSHYLTYDDLLDAHAEFKVVSCSITPESVRPAFVR